MQRLLLLGAVWLVFIAAPSHGVALLSQDFPQPLSFTSASAWQQTLPDVNDRLFEDTASVSHALSVQCAQQSEELFARARRCKSVPVEQQKRVSHFRSAPVPTSLLVRFFLHRKIAPPATAGDPFLR
jgi:hypothetical protein